MKKDTGEHTVAKCKTALVCASPLATRSDALPESNQPEMETRAVKKRCSEDRIIGFLREADAGLQVKDFYRKHGFSRASQYACKAKLRKLLAHSIPEIDAVREVLKGKQGL